MSTTPEFKPKVFHQKVQPVEAVELTEENLEVVASWCGASSKALYLTLLQNPHGIYVAKPMTGDDYYWVYQANVFLTEYEEPIYVEVSEHHCLEVEEPRMDSLFNGGRE